MLIEFWHTLESGRRVWAQVDVTEFSATLLSALTDDSPDAGLVMINEFSPKDVVTIESDAVTEYEDRKRAK